MPWRFAVTGLVLLGACAEIGAEPLPPLPSVTVEQVARDLEFDVAIASYSRAYEQSFTEEPFEGGRLAVIAEEEGQLATYTLVPCQGGAAICGGGPQGPAGRLLRTLDWFVVQGLYGRTFWLSYGGDGYLGRGGRYIPLAWNAVGNGTGPGTAPSLETPFPH